MLVWKVNVSCKSKHWKVQSLDFMHVALIINLIIRLIINPPVLLPLSN